MSGGGWWMQGGEVPGLEWGTWGVGCWGAGASGCWGVGRGGVGDGVWGAWCWIVGVLDCGMLEVRHRTWGLRRTGLPRLWATPNQSLMRVRCAKSLYYEYPVHICFSRQY